MQTRAAVLLLLALAACGDDGADPPTLPDPSAAVLSGRVHLEGNMFTLQGDSLGIRRVEDADGVRVRVACADNFGATTTSVDGVYHLEAAEGAPDDSCVVVGYVGAWNEGGTGPILFDRDLENPRTLLLRPRGEMRIAPNPFTQDHGAGAEWIAEIRDLHTLEIYRLDGTFVYSIADTVLAGFNHFHWGGVDQTNTPVAPGMYWYVIRRGDDVRWNLAFME